MEIKKTLIQDFENKIAMLSTQFLIASDGYRNKLRQKYLEGNNETKNIQSTDQLKSIYSEMFILSSQINSNIVNGNQTIENLDDYLDDLKETVTKENKLLGQVKNSQQAAVPRKINIEEQMNEKYITTSYFILAIAAASYSIYKHYK
jgi:predicted  nucleic acid-binding Zn-ribbon protein|tara:strand:+ start:1235 stop:1675 length:441 start_codon:yes stop_codon:yes gene_type:complete